MAVRHREGCVSSGQFGSSKVDLHRGQVFVVVVVVGPPLPFISISISTAEKWMRVQCSSASPPKTLGMGHIQKGKIFEDPPGISKACLASMAEDGELCSDSARALPPTSCCGSSMA